MGQVNSDNNQEAHSQAKWRIGDEAALFTNSPWPVARALSVVYKSWKLGGVLSSQKMWQRDYLALRTLLSLSVGAGEQSLAKNRSR